MQDNSNQYEESKNEEENVEDPRNYSPQHDTDQQPFQNIAPISTKDWLALQLNNISQDSENYEGKDRRVSIENYLNLDSDQENNKENKNFKQTLYNQREHHNSYQPEYKRQSVENLLMKMGLSEQKVNQKSDNMRDFVRRSRDLLGLNRQRFKDENSANTSINVTFNSGKRGDSQKKRKVENFEELKDSIIQPDIIKKLFPHQIIGVKWLYANYLDKMGCILGDDMGLGKTVQISVYLGCLFQTKKIRQCLIVVPATLLDYWNSEIIRWTPNINIQIQMLNQDFKKRETAIKVNNRRKTVFITSPNVVAKHIDTFGMYSKLDLLVIDEGHKAKNINTKFRKSLKDLYVSRQKVILTGTPVQNNLNEFYSLIDIINDGVLGAFKEFQSTYSTVIERGLKKNAKYYNVLKAQEMIQQLKNVYKPHFLRRTKKEIFKIKSSELSEVELLPNELPIKSDLVIWIPLNEIQKRIYKLILEEDQVMAAQKHLSKKHIFIIILALKQLCVHPLILLHTFFNNFHEEIDEDELEKEAKAIENDQEDIEDISDDETKRRMVEEVKHQTLAQKLGLRYIKRMVEDTYDFKDYENWVKQSTKIQFLFQLLKELHQSGHKVLIFSKLKILLNIVQQVIENDTEYKFLRLDGDVPISARDGLCNKFNSDPSIFCFLLTNQVSGVGLNLVSADRAVIIDPDWNPANDNQCIDRVYRIGQKRDVIVYRLISTCSVEEKIYRRQVYKSSLSKATLESNSEKMMKYFDEQDLVELMKFDEKEKQCYTLDLIQERHPFEIVETPTNTTHMEFLNKNEYVAGITNNATLFSKEEELEEEEEEEYEDMIQKQFSKYSKQRPELFASKSKNRNPSLPDV
eukprot:403340600